MKWLPKELFVRLNAKIAQVFTSVSLYERAKKTSVKEHAKAITTLDKNSLLAQHHMLHQYEIDLEGDEIIDRSAKWKKKKKRLVLEAWHSVREVNSINEHITFPNIYMCTFASTCCLSGTF